MEWIASPNYTPNRAGHNPNWTVDDKNTWIVIHTMDGWMAGTIQAFKSSTRQASSTYAVGLDGRKVQFVREADAPWTNGTMAGIGSNLDSITIECEDGGNYNGPRTPALFEALAQIVADVARRRNIPLIHRGAGGGILGHKECQGSSTACPDSLLNAFPTIIARAKAINNPTPTPPPTPPPDNRPEWLKNLRPNKKIFVITKPVPIVKMATGVIGGTVPAGTLDVAYETTSGGVPYWVTLYGADPTRGNGERKTDVENALAPPPAPPGYQESEEKPFSSTFLAFEVGDITEKRFIGSKSLAKVAKAATIDVIAYGYAKPPVHSTDIGNGQPGDDPLWWKEKTTGGWVTDAILDTGGTPNLPQNTSFDPLTPPPPEPTPEPVPTPSPDQNAIMALLRSVYELLKKFFGGS